ncbi:MAG: MgtC/SapB family protein [Burkholderiaceae bacterium]|nr:MgtC/SapB family protein [Burkholderiaceae bacterium]
MSLAGLIDRWLADPAYLTMALRLLAALAVGGAIGIERSYHGRPAGFRTHALVCLSISLLMLVTIYENRWFPELTQGRVALDPTRMAQGIMTGIGFLGAGTIMKEGPTVRGLTTAASIWITAAIGVLIGIGFYFPALVATVLTLGTLSVFRWIETRMPAQFYAHFTIRFRRAATLPEGPMRELLSQMGFTVANLNYRLDAAADFFEYRMVIRTSRMDNLRRLTDALVSLDSVREFNISPTGD